MSDPDEHRKTAKNIETSHMFRPPHDRPLICFSNELLRKSLHSARFTITKDTSAFKNPPIGSELSIYTQKTRLGSSGQSGLRIRPQLATLSSVAKDPRRDKMNTGRHGSKKRGKTQRIQLSSSCLFSLPLVLSPCGNT